MNRLTRITPRVKKVRTSWASEYMCSCGNTIVLEDTRVNTGAVKSCGCLRKETSGARKRKHGFSKKERLNSIWHGMKDRCNNKNSTSFKNYGGKGIKICDEWSNDYPVFREWAMNNGYNDKLTIERKDVNLGYNPSNCKWITKSEQGKNTSRVIPRYVKYAIKQDSYKMSCKEIKKKYGVSSATITMIRKSNIVL